MTLLEKIKTKVLAANNHEGPTLVIWQPHPLIKGLDNFREQFLLLSNDPICPGRPDAIGIASPSGDIDMVFIFREELDIIRYTWKQALEEWTNAS